MNHEPIPPRPPLAVVVGCVLVGALTLLLFWSPVLVREVLN